MSYVDEINRAGEISDIYAKALSTPRNIDGVAFDGTGNITHFAVCATAADTAAKTATITGFSLATGSQVTIKFTNGNTAANPTLEINNSGAKSIKSAGTTTLTPDTIAAGETVQLVYDGTNWMLINGNLYPELSNVKSTLIVSETPLFGRHHTASTQWTTGQYRISDGAIRAESSRIRMYDYLNRDVKTVISTDATYKLILVAWDVSGDTDSYVGWWDGSAFSTKTSTYAFDELNISLLNDLYPNYKFKLMVQKTDISVSEAVKYIEFVYPYTYVTPQMFGAKGDGTTDDTKAIQACIDADCGCIIIPSGTYLVTKTINVNKNKTIRGNTDSVIYMPSQDATTYIFELIGVNFVCERVQFESTHDKPDASIFERDSASVFSNVRGFDVKSCGRVEINGCKITNLESLAFADIGAGSGNGTLIIKGCESVYTQMFLFAANTDRIEICDCIIRHSNSSRLDHSFYLAHDNGMIVINNIQTIGCYGVPVHLYGVEGYSDIFDKAFIFNSYISARNGGIITMYGDVYVSACVIECNPSSNSIALRNKGGKMTAENCEVLSATYLLYSEVGTGANPNAVPESTLKYIISNTDMIEGFYDTNIVDGRRVFDSCQFHINRTGPFNGVVVCESANAEYEINNCSVEKDDAQNIVALFYSNIGTPVKLIKNSASEGFCLFNGLATNVVACSNIAYIEKGSSVESGGIFQGNVILS